VGAHSASQARLQTSNELLRATKPQPAVALIEHYMTNIKTMETRPLGSERYLGELLEARVLAANEARGLAGSATVSVGSSGSLLLSTTRPGARVVKGGASG